MKFGLLLLLLALGTVAAAAVGARVSVSPRGEIRFVGAVSNSLAFAISSTEEAPSTSSSSSNSDVSPTSSASTRSARDRPRSISIAPGGVAATPLGRESKFPLHYSGAQAQASEEYMAEANFGAAASAPDAASAADPAARARFRDLVWARLNTVGVNMLFGTKHSARAVPFAVRRALDGCDDRAVVRYWVQEIIHAGTLARLHLKPEKDNLKNVRERGNDNLTNVHERQE